MVNIENMTINDIAAAIKLTDTKNWGFQEEDFKFMLEIEPHGCFIVLDDNDLIALTTTVSFESLGWIGNVIVNSRYRERGIGSLLMRHSISYLKNRGVKTVGLYSYLDTVSFYNKLGFKCDSTVSYLVGSGVKCSKVKTVKPMGEKDLNLVIKLDKTCVGVSRERLLRGVFTRSKKLCFVAYDRGELIGFVMGAKSLKTAEIGPLICRPSYGDIAIDLFNVLLNKFVGLDVYVGIPEDKLKLVSTIHTLGFTENFKVIRMYQGADMQDKGCLFAIESLERG